MKIFIKTAFCHFSAEIKHRFEKLFRFDIHNCCVLKLHNVCIQHFYTNFWQRNLKGKSTLLR